MQALHVRTLRLAALAVALTACASETINSPTSGVQPKASGGTVSATGGVVISQVYGGGGNSGATLTNDFVELYNAGTSDISLNGWSVQYASKAGTTWQVTTLSGTIASGQHYLVQESKGSGGTDTLPTPDAIGTIAMSATDGKVALVNSTTALSGACPLGTGVIDFVGFGAANCFEGTAATPALSNTKADFRANGGATDTNDNSADFTTGAPNPHNSNGTAGGGGGGGGGGTGSGSISLGGAAIPVGFQTELFVNNGSKDKSGNTVGNSDVTWSSSAPSIISIDPNTGVITAASAGSVTITATAKSDSSTGTTTATAFVATLSPTARIGHNVDEGTPTDANPSDDIIIARRQYTLSYNVNHGGPNWVSWNLDASHLTAGASSPRCNCFTADTALTRMRIKAYDTSDWINGGVWSRGHMSPSADWGDSDGDNAPTFFLSNMIPQNQTANAGAWGNLENDLRDTARTGAEIYIISGPIFTKNRSGAGVDGLGYMNSTGHIAVPDSMWKIALIVRDTRSVGSIDSTSEFDLIAVNMPNDASSTGSWTKYLTSVSALQRSTGYDFLSALPDSIEKIVEANDHAPATTLAASSTTTVNAGQPLSVVGKFSDADGRTDAPWSIVFNWGDGTTTKATQLTLPLATTQFARSHSYANPGTYTVTFSVYDKLGMGGSSTLTITVQ